MESPIPVNKTRRHTNCPCENKKKLTVQQLLVRLGFVVNVVGDGAQHRDAVGHVPDGGVVVALQALRVVSHLHLHGAGVAEERGATGPAGLSAPGVRREAGGERGDLIRICFRRGHPTTWESLGGSLGGHEARTRRAMFVRTSRHRSGSSWTSPTCAHGGGRASTRVAGGDVENALFIFGRADTEAVGCPSESAQRQSYLVHPSLVRTHSSLEDRVHDRCPSPSHPPRASARPSPSAAMRLPPAAAPASRYAPP